MRAKHCVQITVMTMFALAIWAPGAEAHISLTTPNPRYTYSMNAQTTFAPCTNTANAVPSGLPATHLKVGVPFTVQWNEVILHTGHFRVALSTTDALLPTVTATPQMPAVPPVLADGLFQHTTVSNPRSFIFTPTAACTACTLQVIQTVDNSATVYYQCADVVVDPAGAGAGGASGTGTGGATGTGGNGTAGGGGRAGSGGATGSGGAQGSGAAPGSGGAQGSGGALGTGGSASGSGGAQGSGGTPGTGGSAVGNGSGGAPTGTGTGGAGTGATPDNSSGGCNVSRTTRAGLIAPLFGALVALALRRRRSRKNGKTSATNH